jgi:hypothetical protein
VVVTVLLFVVVTDHDQQHCYPHVPTVNQRLLLLLLLLLLLQLISS